jgi:hypothetical protein
MLTSTDIERLYKSKEIKRIDNARKAYNEANTDWSKKYWYNVWQKLNIKYKPYKGKIDEDKD